LGVIGGGGSQKTEGGGGGSGGEGAKCLEGDYHGGEGTGRETMGLLDGGMEEPRCCSLGGGEGSCEESLGRVEEGAAKAEGGFCESHPRWSGKVQGGK